MIYNKTNTYTSVFLCVWINFQFYQNQIQKFKANVKIPQQDNHLSGYYLIADHQKDLNPHIQQEYIHLFPKLHKIPQPVQKFKNK